MSNIETTIDVQTVRRSARTRSVPIRTLALTKREVGHDGSQIIRVFGLGKFSVWTEQDRVSQFSSIESDIIPT